MLEADPQVVLYRSGNATVFSEIMERNAMGRAGVSSSASLGCIAIVVTLA
jgi:hypothetical protein